jgi:hypothetical protein
MSVYAFDTALQAMKSNPAIESICYKMEQQDGSNYFYSVERRDGCFWHCCELNGTDIIPCTTVWRRMVSPVLSFRGDIAECLPPPTSPLVRQVATGYLSPKSLKITIPASMNTTPSSEGMAPRSVVMSPFALSLSRQSSLQDQVTGIRENTHLFFDDDGNEISKEEHMANNFNLMIRLTPTGALTSFRHPRVLLFYLRYVGAANELESDTVSWPLLTPADRAAIQTYIECFPPPPEFQEDVNELFVLMNKCPSS